VRAPSETGFQVLPAANGGERSTLLVAGAATGAVITELAMPRIHQGRLRTLRHTSSPVAIPVRLSRPCTRPYLITASLLHCFTASLLTCTFRHKV
jgi:hypothetical protein